MRYYRLSESLVKRVIRFPARVEESIVPDTIACMRPAQTHSARASTELNRTSSGQNKKYSEVWSMYIVTKNKQIKIITAWRYPGKSPERDPIPAEILEEARKVLRNY
ncbi:MAG: hypothetical protein WDZ40_01580 [Candidatus Spechtbacterales bacterium]